MSDSNKKKATKSKNADRLIWPIGTLVLGSFEKFAIDAIGVVKGYNKTKTIMILMVAPHMFSNVTERRCRWSKRFGWRYKEDGIHVRCSIDRRTQLEDEILGLLQKGEMTTRDLYDQSKCGGFLQFACISFALCHLRKDKKIKQVCPQNTENDPVVNAREYTQGLKWAIC